MGPRQGDVGAIGPMVCGSSAVAGAPARAPRRRCRRGPVPPGARLALMKACGYGQRSAIAAGRTSSGFAVRHPDGTRHQHLTLMAATGGG